MVLREDCVSVGVCEEGLEICHQEPSELEGRDQDEEPEKPIHHKEIHTFPTLDESIVYLGSQSGLRTRASESKVPFR